MITIEKLNILTPFQKLPKNVGDLAKIIVAKGFEKLPNLVTLQRAEISKCIGYSKKALLQDSVS